MSDFLKTIIANKQLEVIDAKKKVSFETIRKDAEFKAKSNDDRSVFFERLKQKKEDQVNIIAEIKRASPSKGDIKLDLNPKKLAADYESSGATAISVLTDSKFFKGSLQDLMEAKNASTIPILRKDFTISSYQIYESKVRSADAILLITRILTSDQLKDYLALVKELQLDALVEIHSEKDFEIATLSGAKLIGINNRNLSSFETDTQTSKRLVSLFEPDQLAVAASGIQNKNDILQYKEYGINCFLIGESIVRAIDTKKFLSSLL